MSVKAWRFTIIPALGLAVAMAVAAEPTYVGASKCKVCHKNQYAAWESAKHAKAWDALKPEEQKKSCADCHSTGPDKLTGVQCESCHGPGSEYKRPAIMNKAKWKADPDAQLKLAEAAGLVAKPGEDVCTKCHNDKSPTFEAFNFDQMKEKIKHWE